ncbi:methyltransferase domain-containing protein [Microbacterium trichothecenolyticum]|uniref:methyltransferase domain-containing protein n=1 Tax=Microbacterium trichothecenolyticum TaxID=69370 RepID=UPI001C6EBCCB|nr:methyltransferase domain-containing protein [Microbacterium trichothecenolyticum]MBW9119958.1 methyltransferase domain-containing protein [Microbacterium trichothecenolyticum]
MSLAVRDEGLAELMDDPACDPDLLRATLVRFGTVNRFVSGWGVVYRTRLRPHLASLGRPARVLDIGSGGGDLIDRLAAAARRDGLDVTWTGIDPDPRALEVALARTPIGGASFREADAAALVREGLTYDAVLSNHVLHHLGEGLPAFAEESLALSRGIVLHSDIARSRLAYGLYAVGITPFQRGTFLRTDGLRSIRRSYTRAELTTALEGDNPGVWSVERPVPFRLVAVGRGRA